MRGARRLICQSTLGVGGSRGNLNLLWRYLMFGLLLRQAYADHVRQEQYVVASDPDGTSCALAADLLCQPGSTVGAVARQVGYRTAFAWSAAFNRHRGISPQQYRERAR